MKTTLDIEDDVLQAAKELSQREDRTIGQIISRLARRGLTMSAMGHENRPAMRGGMPLLPSRGEVVTLEQVQRLMDKEDV